MQWDDSENAGFTEGKPWLPVNENYRTLNVKAESIDPDSVLSWFRKLAEIRNEHPVLMDGSWNELLADDPDLIAYERKNDNETVTVIINLSEKEREYDPSLTEGKEILLVSGDDFKHGNLHGLQCVMVTDK
jgi:glycosidase